MNLFNSLNFPINMQPTPTTFNEGFSYYETVSKMIYLVNQMITQVNENTTEEQALKDDYEILLNNLKSLQDTIDSFKDGSSIPLGSLKIDKFDKSFYDDVNHFT